MGREDVFPKKGEGREREEDNGQGGLQTFRIPAVLLIGAFVGALIAVVAWANNEIKSVGKGLDEKKADKSAVAEVKSDVKMLIEMHLKEGYRVPAGYVYRPEDARAPQTGR